MEFWVLTGLNSLTMGMILLGLKLKGMVDKWLPAVTPDLKGAVPGLFCSILNYCFFSELCERKKVLLSS